MQKYLLVALGGSFGAMARYGLDVAITERMGIKFSYGTLVINITACLILGFSMVFLGRRTDINPAWQFLVSIGFIGAYSTFSTFEWETFTSLQAGTFFLAVLYVVLSVVLGLVAVWLGVLLARALS